MLGLGLVHCAPGATHPECQRACEELENCGLLPSLFGAGPNREANCVERCSREQEPEAVDADGSGGSGGSTGGGGSGGASSGGVDGTGGGSDTGGSSNTGGSGGPTSSG